MGLPTFVTALAYERHRARRQERKRLLDEQAERQRRRAPEPEATYDHHSELAALSDRAIFWLSMIPIVPLALLAVFVDPWIFWIGLFVLVIAISIAMARHSM